MKNKNKAVLYVIYRMKSIYNPNIGIIAKIIFNLEMKKNNEFPNNNCSSVNVVSTPFLLLCVELSDRSSS